MIVIEINILLDI